MLRNLHRGHARRSELALHSGDEILFRHRLPAGRNIPEARMQPVVDIAFEGHHAAR